jgi:hypothetical protein
MAKLPDAGDLGNPNFRPARSFSNVPVADYQSAFGALGRGLSDVGEGAQRYAIEVDKRLKDEEAFGVNLRLADAQVQFSSTVSGLDPSDPEFAQKRMKAWSDTFKPIMDGIQHGENKRRFGEWAYENGAKIQIDSDRLALEANTGKTKLQLEQYKQQQMKLVAEGVISAEEASTNIRTQAAQAPYLFENDKQAFMLKDAVEFDEAAVELVGASLIGNARKAPDSWRGYEGRLGLFLGAMQEAGYPLKVSSHYRTPEYQAKLYREKVDELRRRGVPNPEEAARKWVAAPGPDAPHANAASDLVFNGAKLGDKGTEAATKKAHELALEFGLHFRMDHEPWHIEPVKDGSEPPPDVARRGQSELAVLSILQADPVFNQLPPDRQRVVLHNMRVKYRQEFDEQERLDIVAGTRSVVDYAVENYADPEEAREYIREKIQDPLALEDGFALLDKEIAGRKQREEDRKTEMFKSSANKVIELRDAGKTNEALAAIPRDLDAEDREKLRKLALDGPATTDNAKVEGDLWAISYRDPEAFKAVDLTKYRGDLTQETLEKFAKVQEDLKKPGETTSIRTVGSMLDNYYEELGIKSSKDENDIRARNAIERQVGNQILTLEKQLGRKAEMNEIQEVLDTTFMTFSTPGDWWGSNQNSLKDVLGTMQETADEYAMPLDSLYDTAITDLTNNGYDPTPENINRWLGDYKKWRQQKVTPQ